MWNCANPGVDLSKLPGIIYCGPWHTSPKCYHWLIDIGNGHGVSVIRRGNGRYGAVLVELRPDDPKYSNGCPYYVYVDANEYHADDARDTLNNIRKIRDTVLDREE